jgi:hypothetical protein
VSTSSYVSAKTNLYWHKVIHADVSLFFKGIAHPHLKSLTPEWHVDTIVQNENVRFCQA